LCRLIGFALFGSLERPFSNWKLILPTHAVLERVRKIIALQVDWVSVIYALQNEPGIINNVKRPENNSYSLGIIRYPCSFRICYKIEVLQMLNLEFPRDLPGTRARVYYIFKQTLLFTHILNWFGWLTLWVKFCYLWLGTFSFKIRAC